MKIKMDSLVITNYCNTDKRKYRFIKEISEDPLIKYFVSHNMDEWLEDSEDVDKLLIGPAYIIADERRLVGFIRLANLDEEGILNLHYGVHPDYRKKGYGTRILLETSKYLFKNMNAVKEIELYISEINKGSIGCATNAHFVYGREYRADYMVKVYSLKK